MGCNAELMPDHLVPGPPRSTGAQGARETHGVGGVVQQIVIALLPGGYPDLHCVAKLMGLSARTLQRRLSDDGLTFGRLVARARLDVGQRLLNDPGRRVIDVALDLGYSDQAHFARAFARWSGLTPRQFRRLRSIGCPGRAPVDERLTSGRDAAIPRRRRSPSPTRLHLVAGAPQPERAEKQGGLA